MIRMKKPSYSPEMFINRELSWLRFNERVLEESQDTSIPLLERLKFSAIVSSNLDEFFMVRVASIWDQVMAGFDQPDPAGLLPGEVMDRVAEETHGLVSAQYNCYRHSLLPALRKEKIHLLKPAKLSKKQEEFLKDYYKKNVYPVLTPMVVDQGRPFPLVLSRSLNIAILLKNPTKGEPPIFATVQAPSVLDRLIEVPSEHGAKSYIFLEEVMKMHMDRLFSGHRILTMSCFRVTRNADLGFDEEGAEDLLETIQQSLKLRKWGSAIRLEMESSIDPALQSMLEEELEAPAAGVFKISGPLDLTALMQLAALPDHNHLLYPPLRPLIPELFAEEKNIFEMIDEQDILLHHPYDSFDPVVELVQQAARDPKVLAIKQTLYRVSGNSPIVEALATAAENGKQVTALVELKARFDEENNILWAKRLEMAGCHVIYGLVGLKTHAKLLLIVRREEGGIRRYVHMGTGNYNDVTARTYTDLGLFTANPHFGADASAVFNMLSGYSRLTNLKKLQVAPLSLRNQLLDLIRREADHARQGGVGQIIIKANSVVDQEIIHALYAASEAGVKIDLIIRGICCLRPGLPGIGENISVRSIVGRFLEHSRIFYFMNNGDEKIYLASADLMDRNLDRRVEIMFPIDDQDLRQTIKNLLDLCLRDTVKSRILDHSGNYTRMDKRGKALFNMQEHLAMH